MFRTTGSRVTAAWLLAVGAFVGCTNDYESFSSNNSTGAGATSGTTSVGGMGGSTSAGGAAGSSASSGSGGSLGGSAGSPTGGSGGSAECGATQKLCAANCADIDNPMFGCTTNDCAPCELGGATAGCQNNQCAIASCDMGFSDCNSSDGDGCEVEVETDDQNCGACGNDCSSQGFVSAFSCQTGQCGCTSATDCKGGGPGTGNCNAGVCACNATTCNAGEACRRVGNSQVCACNGNAACSTGGTCCPNAGCVDAQSDDANCGGCGVTCGSGETCTTGTCS